MHKRTVPIASLVTLGLAVTALAVTSPQPGVGAEVTPETPVVQTITVEDYVAPPVIRDDYGVTLPVTSNSGPATIEDDADTVEVIEEVPSVDGPHVDWYYISGLEPCFEESDDDCFWDAEAFGNGEGTSFFRWRGVTYYPEG